MSICFVRKGLSGVTLMSRASRRRERASSASKSSTPGIAPPPACSYHRSVRQDLYFCASKSSKLRTFVSVKQFKCIPAPVADRARAQTPLPLPLPLVPPAARRTGAAVDAAGHAGSSRPAARHPRSTRPAVPHPRAPRHPTLELHITSH
jgi:hypothetical protein